MKILLPAICTVILAYSLPAYAQINVPRILETTSPVDQFSPRALPEQTKAGLEKWGLNEAAWRMGKSVTLIALIANKRSELENAIATGNDPVALVIMALYGNLDSEELSHAPRWFSGEIIGDSVDRALAGVNEESAVFFQRPMDEKLKESAFKVRRSELLRKATALDDPVAQYVLAEDLLNSAPSSEFEEGRRLYLLAAEGGVVPAMRDLAGRYEGGNGFAEDKAMAAQWAQRCASLGNVKCMTRAAISFDEGWAGPVDRVAAVIWMRRAGALGDVGAMVVLGDSYWFGEGVPQDRTIAVTWYQRAADLGNRWAMVSLGKALKSGEGVTRNPAASVSWFRKAADEGNTEGMVNLGLAMMVGEGVAPNEVAGLDWIRRAAEQGDTKAMYLFAAFLETGFGRVPKNRPGASYWYTRAVRAGDLNPEWRAQANDALRVYELQGIVPAKP